MKIYLFAPETGVYLGEDLAKKAPLKSGVFVIPHHATRIPPPQSEPGHLLVFNAGKHRWEVHHRQGKGSTNADKSQRT